MIDWGSRLGKNVHRRLNRDRIIWLTTTDQRGWPQPRPVWFLWHENRCLIFSQPRAAKLAHIRLNPWVSLNLNSDPDGGEVTVLLGPAHILRRSPHASLVAGYVRKYRAAIRNLGFDPRSFFQDYSVAITVTPRKLRGF